MASGVNETIHAQLTLVPFQYHKAKNKLANAHFTRLCELLKIIQTLGRKDLSGCFLVHICTFHSSYSSYFAFLCTSSKIFRAKMEPTIISSFLCHPVVFANYLILSKFLDKYILLNLTICLIVLTHYLHIAQHNYPNHIFQNT